jgi:hypothetical protein
MEQIRSSALRRDIQEQFAVVSYHEIGIRYVSYIPVGNVGRELVRSVKHLLHGCCAARVPAGNVPVEHPAMAKCLVKLGHTRHIPSRDIALKCNGIVKQCAHAGDSTRIPPRQVSTDKRLCIKKH